MIPQASRPEAPYAASTLKEKMPEATGMTGGMNDYEDLDSHDDSSFSGGGVALVNGMNSQASRLENPYASSTLVQKVPEATRMAGSMYDSDDSEGGVGLY